MLFWFIFASWIRSGGHLLDIRAHEQCGNAIGTGCCGNLLDDVCSVTGVYECVFVCVRVRALF